MAVLHCHGGCDCYNPAGRSMAIHHSWAGLYDYQSAAKMDQKADYIIVCGFGDCNRFLGF